MYPYHSALLPELATTPCKRVIFGESTAFVHDLTRGIPLDYDRCDVFYTEMPWRPGYAKFLERAGVSGTSSFLDYVKALCTITERQNPFIVILGASLLRYFPDPTTRLNIRFPRDLHKGAECIAIAYNVDLPQGIRTTVDVTTWLAGAYSCVGDPSCGYGNTGRVFVENGKTCILSDINPKCIGWIAGQCADWIPR